VVPTLRHLPDAELWYRIHRDRNVVGEMVARLRAVKPNRSPRRELQVAPMVSLIR
jgi:hypothetical protein